MVYHVFANKTNIGDWLSALGIQQLIDAREITECYCDANFIPATIKKLSCATEKDLVIIGGGGLIMDYFQPFWEAFLPVSKRVPFIIWGIGCCDIKHESSLPSKDLLRSIVSESKFCSVRDEMTRKFLDLDCEVVPCPSINAISKLEIPGIDILHVVNYSTAGANAYEHMRAVTQDFAGKTGIIYEDTNNLVDKEDKDGLEKIIETYRKSAIIVSSALHGCIIAFAMGLKLIAVSGDNKIDEFMKAAGLEKWILNFDHTGPLKKMLGEIAQQPDPDVIRENIRRQNLQIGQQVQKLIKGT